MPSVAVAIPTYRRPHLLAAMLPRVAEQTKSLAAQGFDTEIVVIDNDPERTAEAVVREFGGVRYVCQPEPGIAAVRNRALDEVSSDALVFIDDDEIPQPEWLTRLVTTWTDSGATGVVGRVRSVFETELDPWVAAGGFWDRVWWPTGTWVEAAATGNLLLDVAQVRDLGVRFDEGLGLSGGEDTLFTRQLTRRGGRIVWCAESIADDQVPPARTTRRWLMRRAWSQGVSRATVASRLAENRRDEAVARVGVLARGFVRLVGGAGRLAWGLLTRRLDHQARGARTMVRGAGMLAGSVGHTHQEYAAQRLGSRR